MKTHRENGDVIAVRGLIGADVSVVDVGALDAVALAARADGHAAAGDDDDVTVGWPHDVAHAVGRGEDVTIADDRAAAEVMAALAKGHLVRELVDVGVHAADDPRSRLDIASGVGLG